MDQLTQLADDFYDHAMSESPLSLMWVGKLTHLDKWDDFSDVGVEANKAANLAFVERAKSVDPGDDPQRQALHAVITNAALASAKGAQWDTPLFHVNPKMGAFEMILSFVDNFELITAEHGEAYLTKLRTLPQALAQIADVAHEYADRGIVALETHLIATADSVAAYLATPAGSEERLCAQQAPKDFDADAAAAWRETRDELVASVVRPGLAAYETSLRDLAKRGMPDEKPGLCHLPGGEHVYRDKIWANLLMDKDPREVHELGLQVVAKLEDEYREIAGPLLGTTDISEIYSRLRDDESLKYRHEEVLIAEAELALKKADQAAPDYFRTVPVTPCLAEASHFGAMAYYSSPDPDTGKVGKFYFNTANPAAWSTYELEAIVFHEGIPGHHLQLALHAENTALHKVQREIHNTAYAEGWGLYTERLADEMGLYSSQLSRVGMLSADSLRAGRLVVDTGIHALGWSREQAIQYLLDHSPMDRAHVEQEIDRYIGLPGQALSYMIGRLEIMSIRDEAAKLPGYDIRDFHDAVLKYGAVPLPTLRAQVLGSFTAA